MLKISSNKFSNICHYFQKYTWPTSVTKPPGPIKIEIKYYLHCPKTDVLEFESFPRDAMLKCKKKHHMKILIHGWMADKDTEWYEPAIKEYMQTGNVNVLAVDWGKHAKGLYTTSVDLVKSIGEMVADTIIDIATNHTMHYHDFHMIGHSLGAHICGYAGKRIIAVKGIKIGRITGCDPAGPSFEGNHPDDRLYGRDADFVDIIHTDAGVLGYEKSLGHIDFYPNGGKRQYGCHYGNSEVGCNHCRAPLYMAESVNSSKFVAVKAKDFAEFDTMRYSNDSPRTVMGEHVDKKLRGDFFLYTNKKPPYGRGKI